MIDPHKAKQTASITGDEILDAIEALNHCASDIVEEPSRSALRRVARALENLRNREIAAIVRGPR